MRAVATTLTAALALSGCADEKSNCSDVPGTWSMDFRASTWNAPICPAQASLTLSTPAAQPSQCHDGCTCSLGDFSMQSEHDESDFCATRFEESCASDSSSMSCTIELDTNTQASGFCRKTFSNRQDPCDYNVDFVKR